MVIANGDGKYVCLGNSIAPETLNNHIWMDGNGETTFCFNVKIGIIQLKQQKNVV